MKLTLGTLVLALLLSPRLYADARQDIVVYLKSSEEPTVKDATWISHTMLAVGVVDDGSDRTGFAEYVCNLVRERGVRGVNVKVIDIVKLVNDDGFQNLSKRVDCETFKRW
ncbi:MAG: hypothetical protein R3E82_05115 [Pseudomonadales bacterium]